MPFRSQAQQRFAFGTGQPWAKRWADETDFSKLPKRVRRIRSKAGLKGCTCKAVANDTAPMARPVAAAPTAPAAKPAAGGKGELIAPGVRRIRGNLCNVHGRYGPCDAGLKKPKGGKGRAAKPKKAPKPKQTPEQRAAARAQQHEQNRANVAQQMADNDTGLSPSGSKALAGLVKGEQPDKVHGDGLVKMGLAEQAADGSYRLSGTGHAVNSAMEAGDYQRAIDGISRGTDAASGRASRATARQERTAAAEERKRQAQAKRDAVAVRRAKRGSASTPAQRGGGGGAIPSATPPARTGAAPSHSGGGSSGGSSGGSYTAPKPKPAAGPKPGVQAPPAKPQPDVTTPALADAARKLSAGETLTPQETDGLVRNGLARVDKKTGAVILTVQGQRATRQTKKERRARFKAARSQAAKQDTLTIYKDASGVDRWLMVSSTAYRDRDREIVSTKALEGAVALADASGYRGPLRFWHVPGVDLGDCDFQATAQDGRFLLESGTFRSPALAAAVKAKADRYQVSIGFTHPANEPDAEGVFSHIAIFERSLVPRGRASNPFTQVAIKESRMLTNEKEAELRTLLNGDESLLQGLLGNVAQTDKAAQDGGVAYKDTDLRAIIREELASLLRPAEATKEADAETEKAAPPAFATDEADTAPETKADMPMDGMDQGEPEGDENMLTDAEIQAIAAAVVEALSPILNMESKMAAHLGEMKSLIGGYASQKDSALAEVKTDLSAVKAQVADLSGSAPRILAGGYRASQAATTVTTDETKLKDAQPTADPVAQSYSAFLTELGFGQPGA